MKNKKITSNKGNGEQTDAVLTRNFIIVSENIFDYLNVLEYKADKANYKYDKEILRQLFIKIGRIKENTEAFYKALTIIFSKVTEDYIITNCDMVLEAIRCDEEEFNKLGKPLCSNFKQILEIEARGIELIINYCDDIINNNPIESLNKYAENIKNDKYFQTELYIKLNDMFGEENDTIISYFISDFVTKKSGRYAYNYIISKRTEKDRKNAQDISNTIYQSVGRNKKLQRSNIKTGWFTIKN